MKDILFMEQQLNCENQMELINDDFEVMELFTDYYFMAKEAAKELTQWAFL